MGFYNKTVEKNYGFWYNSVMKKSVGKKHRAFLPVTAFVLVALVLPCLSGCFGSCFGLTLTSLEFKNDTLMLNIGDVYTVTPSAMVFYPALAADKSFTLSTDDATVVETDGRQIRAVGAGETNVTAIADSNPDVTAVLRVEVGYPEPTQLSLSVKGSRVQYAGHTEKVEFTAVADVEIAPHSEFVWTVDGERDEVNRSANYGFVPKDEVGVYKISVALGDIEAHTEVRVFTKEIETASVDTEGDLEQLDDYTPVKFTVEYTGTEGDPAPFTEWYINDELYMSDTETFLFTPPVAGVYKVSLLLNGKTVPIGEHDVAVVTARGSITPANVKVSFDNSYPDIFVTWSYPHTRNTGYRIKIEKISGGSVVSTNETVSSTNVSTKHVFDGASANIGSFVDLSADSYRISVRSLGDGGVYTESDYSASVTLEKLSSSAVSALSRKVLGGTMDHYITDDDEFNRLYAYYMSFRGANGKSISYEAYMAYNSGFKMSELVNSAFDYGASTGSYYNSYKLNGKGSFQSGAKRPVAGDTVQISVDCNSTLAPTKSGGSEYTQLNALAPHVAENSERTSSYVFPIERLSASAAVSTSEELYRAAEYGVRPVCASGSTAQRLYNYSRRLLIEIISDEMTDAEKVHAIYDWIMWNVMYDYEAIKSSDAAVSAAFKAYWLEGVLTDNNRYAVCDGMSKAMSFLCRMEGIPAYRVTGIAGDSVAGMSYFDACNFKETEWGGHAWNKVYVDGAWYVVDATWGDSLASVKGRVYEMAWHDWLLLSDKDISDTHEYDHTTNNPTTADTSYNIYDKTELEYVDTSGEPAVTDMYIDGVGSRMDEQIYELMEYLHYMRTVSTGSVSIGGSTQLQTYIGVEIKAEKMSTLLSKATDELRNPFRQKLQSLGYSYSVFSKDYEILGMSDKILVMLKR